MKNHKVNELIKCSHFFGDIHYVEVTELKHIFDLNFGNK